MDMDEQTFSTTSPYSRRPTNQNRMNNHPQPLRDHIPHPAPRQYTTAPGFQDNYGIEPPPSMLQNTPRYPDSSRTIKEEHGLNPYLYSAPTEFREEVNLIVHHPTQADHNTIRYPASHNQYPSDLNNSNRIHMASSPPEARITPGPAEAGSLHLRYQMNALPQHLLHPQRHQHGSLPQHQHQNHVLNHIQGSPTFFSPMSYNSLDQEHRNPGGGGLDQQPQTQLSSLEYDSREQHVSVSGIVYDSLHEPMAVPGHSQQGVRRDPTLNHRGSLASSNSNNSASGSYHTTNLQGSSIPMSNNRGTAPSMNTSMSGAHTSSSFNSRWAGHPFDMTGSTAGTRSQVPLTPASTSASSLRPILSHSECDSRVTSPENSFTQDNFHLRTSTSAQTLSSSHSTHSHTNSPSPRLSDNESNIGGRRFGSELFSQDDRESDQDVETVARMSEMSSTGRKEVIRAGEEVGETFLAPIKKKKKSKMHCCEVCFKKFPRPSGLRTHMNMHSNEKPFPCGFPGCTRSFGVRSNAKRHLRTHGVIPTPAINPNSADAPYIVGFCPPMIGVSQSSSHQQSQLHSLEGGEDCPPPGSRLLGDINTQDQGQNDVQNSAPILKLRWMPQSLTTRTNAGSLREARDRQHWMGDVVEGDDGEDEDDFVGGSGIGVVRRASGGGYGMDMEQEDLVDDGDEVEFGENVPRQSIPLHPVIPSSSTSAIAPSSTGIRLTVSHPAECMCSPPCSESSTQATCRRSRTIASISSVSSTSFVGSNSSLSPSSMVAYRQHEIEIARVGHGGGYTTRAENISQEYGVREPRRAEERNSYLETGSQHPYHPSQHPKYFR